MNGLPVFLRMVIGVTLISCILSGCSAPETFNENQSFQNNEWTYTDVKSFSVDVEDTASTYDIYVQLRHSSQFEWRNLWIKIQTVFPDNTEKERRIDLLLSDPAGVWYGDCLGENCDRVIKIQSKAKFPAKGTYIFRIAQDMRENPLKMLKSVGVLIEKNQGTGKN